MSFIRTAEQQQFAASVHDLLSGADVPGAARRWAGGDLSGGLALWRTLATLGVTALAVPERHGGLGASLPDVVIACEELGHHALPGPVAESVAAVPLLLASLADESPCCESPCCESGPARWLSGLAAGDLIATLALPPWLPYAADAGAAGLILLADGDTVWLAGPGSRRQSVDPTRSLHEARGREVLARGSAVTSAAGLCAGGRSAGLRGATAGCGPRPAGAERAPRRAADPVRPADRRVPGGQASPRRGGDQAGVRPAAARRRSRFPG